MMRFEELGRCVAELQDVDRQSVQDTERASQRFLRSIRNAPRLRERNLLLVATVVAVAAAACLLWSKYPSALAALWAEAPGIVVGRSIRVPDSQAIPLSFPDGSRMVLTGGTNANVKSLTSDGATVDIENGHANVSVVHRNSTRWSIHAGPYRVSVTGTKFTVGWAPKVDRFYLTLDEGAVVVTTEGRAHGAVTMTAPEQLVIEHGDWRLSPPTKEPSATPSLVPLTEVALVAKGNDATSRTGVSTVTGAHSGLSSPLESAPEIPEWQRLGTLGKFGNAYASASETGIANISLVGSAQSLLTLAEVCRFAGHASEAMLVLTKLRQRFGGSNEAAIAAFQLGRLSSEGQLAASWFRRYVRERPNGELAREASGRLLEALERASDQAGALVAAQSYLERYPTGPHASFARRLKSR